MIARADKVLDKVLDKGALIYPNRPGDSEGNSEGKRNAERRPVEQTWR